jgi:hypothetical protein
MKKLGLVLVCLFALGGCELSNVAKIQKELGVTVQGDIGSYCHQYLLGSLITDYNKLSDSAKEQVKQQVRDQGIKAIDLQPSVQVGQADGTMVTLIYAERGQQSPINRAEKLILDKRDFNGKKPGYSFSRNSVVLTIASSFVLDESVHRIYRTLQVEVYDRVEQYDSPEFRKAQQQNLLGIVDEVATGRQACGAPARLAELVAIPAK